MWDALGADLLCPFHYFALADGTDLKAVSWTRGRYDTTELESLYTGNDSRARIVLAQLRDKVLDLSAMRALGFCVSVAHAEFMARVFRAAGIQASAVSGSTPPAERAQALQALRNRTVNVLFAADLFNEGLDLPDVDTRLMLRPTESATIFIQQLGRGLRRTRTKPVVTVLDFVGHQRKEFIFDLKLRALTGQSRRQLEQEVERGFPFLPAGCQIVMDRQAQASILENLRTQLGRRWRDMVAELRSSGDSDLRTFLNESRLDLAEVVRGRNHSWTRLRRDAHLSTRQGASSEAQLLRRIRAFAHVDDGPRQAGYRRLLSDSPPTYNHLSEVEQRLARMLTYSLWPDGGGHRSYQDALSALTAEPAVRDELNSVLDISFESARHNPLALPAQLLGLPLMVHARYQREEILAGFGHAQPGRTPSTFREGVLYLDDLNVDAFFVTLTKSDAEYSPTTMYQDYPISRTLFHWEFWNRPRH